MYIKWALHQYPNVDNADDVLSIVFEKGLIPAMRDEKVRNPKKHQGFRHLRQRHQYITLPGMY